MGGRPRGHPSGPRPRRFRDRRAGRAGLRESSRACPARRGRPEPEPGLGWGLPGPHWRGAAGRAPEPVPPGKHALAGHRPTLWSGASHISSYSPGVPLSQGFRTSRFGGVEWKGIC